MDSGLQPGRYAGKSARGLHGSRSLQVRRLARLQEHREQHYFGMCPTPDTPYGPFTLSSYRWRCQNG